MRKVLQVGTGQHRTSPGRDCPAMSFVLAKRGSQTKVLRATTTITFDVPSQAGLARSVKILHH